MSHNRNSGNRIINTMRGIRRNKSVYFLIAPFFILFILFTVIPTVMSIPAAFTDYDMINAPKWVGLTNFKAVLSDPLFWKAVSNVFIFALIVAPVSFFLCFIFAWLINEMPKIIRPIFMCVFFIPALTGNIYIVWQLLFSDEIYGLANNLLFALNLTSEKWQWQTNGIYSIPVSVCMQLWSSLGAGFLVLTAGFSTVPRELYEAAAIDGVKNRVQRLIHITLPSILPLLLFTAVMQLSVGFAAGGSGAGGGAYTLVSYINDYGFNKMSFAYTAAVCALFFTFVSVIYFIVKKDILVIAGIIQNADKKVPVYKAKKHYVRKFFIKLFKIAAPVIAKAAKKTAEVIKSLTIKIIGKIKEAIKARKTKEEPKIEEPEEPEEPKKAKEVKDTEKSKRKKGGKGKK